MSFPRVISFYTADTPYQLEIQNLIASCNRFAVSIDVEAVESFGSWELNCAFKPFFILKKLNEYKQPVLWVDADGVFTCFPEWIEAFNADISVRINESLPASHPSKVISSTLFVNYNSNAIECMHAWAKESARQLLDPSRKEEFWDQIALRDVLFSDKNRFNIAGLPLSYAKNFDHPEDLKSFEPSVIEHYQASRRFKKIINNS
jgi:hypothetical protein